MRVDFNTSGRNPIDWVHKERCMRKVLPNYDCFGGRRQQWWNRCCRPIKEGVSNICLQFEGNCKYSREGQLGQLRLMCKSTTAGFFSSLHGLDFLCFYCLQPQFFLFKTHEMGLITTFVHFVTKKKSNKLSVQGINCTLFFHEDSLGLLSFPSTLTACYSAPCKGGPEEVTNNQK